MDTDTDTDTGMAMDLKIIIREHERLGYIYKSKK